MTDRDCKQIEINYFVYTLIARLLFNEPFKIPGIFSNCDQ